MRLRLAVLLIGLAGLASAQAQPDPQAGQVKAATCLGCHGVAGYANVYPSFRVPKLAGQHADYLVSALQAYRSDQRRHPTMRAQAKSMTDQDMQDIAAYFASLGRE